MVISGITTPLSRRKRLIVKACFCTSTSAPSARAVPARSADANGRAASSGRRRMALSSGSGRTERQNGNGARRQALAIGLRPDEQQADQAARNHEGPEDDITALVSGQRA